MFLTVLDRVVVTLLDRYADGPVRVHVRFELLHINGRCGLRHLIYPSSLFIFECAVSIMIKTVQGENCSNKAD